ncbi:MAG: GtrA family protein [Akkermansiaceae bacterium]|nr:GtrA family protein [Akkermansiaceae bacterium]
MKASPDKEIRAILRLGHKQSWKAAALHLASTEAAPVWQFAKYLAIGVLSVPVFLSGCWLFRASVVWLDPQAYPQNRPAWLLLEITMGFLTANAFTYETNRRWVFKAGRHSRAREFTLFTVSAALCFAVAQTAAFLLISYSSTPDLVVKMTVIILSTLVNFISRKTIVFSS